MFPPLVLILSLRMAREKRNLSSYSELRIDVLDGDEPAEGIMISRLILEAIDKGCKESGLEDATLDKKVQCEGY